MAVQIRLIKLGSYVSIRDEVYTLLKKNGAMGVNALSKELNIPLSTMQKYLDKDQTYFKKNHSRKWELPEESAKSDIVQASGNMTNIIDSQISSMQILVDTLMSQFRSTISLMEANKGNSEPVAYKSHDIDPRLIKTDKTIKDTHALIKAHIKNVPEEYKEILLNLDILELVLKRGTETLFSPEHTDLTDVLTGNATELSDKTVELLNTFQKGV